MDCKRPHQYRALRQLLFLAVSLLPLSSCKWVKDDLEGCNFGFWLQLRYSYNILDVDAAPNFVKDAYIDIYDAGGVFVKHMDVSGEYLKDNDYKVQIEDLEEGDYQFVVWSGISDKQYVVSDESEFMEDFRVSLAGTGASSSSALPALFYGSLPVVHYDESYAVHEVNLMKDTNQLACLVVSVDDSAEIKPGDFTLKVTAVNSVMDAGNKIVTTKSTEYTPFSEEPITLEDQEYGELHGAAFNLSTLRLMADGKSRIILERKDGGQTVFNISFSDYIGMIGALYTNLGRPLSVQEYLDRQDFYTVVFFLSEDMTHLVQLQVNSWRLRAYNHLKL